MTSIEQTIQDILSSVTLATLQIGTKSVVLERVDSDWYNVITKIDNVTGVHGLPDPARAIKVFRDECASLINTLRMDVAS